MADATADAVAPATNEGAVAFVNVLVANGVEHIFLMPGTDTFPIQEAIARARAHGRVTPNVVLCQHETMAVAAAHGYYALTGRPQLCLVHVDVGTQMAGGMVSNAQRGRAGLVLCAGKTPVEIEGKTRAGRSREVHWLQDRQDQAGIVRDYVKWSYDVSRTENLGHAVQRAFQLARSAPAGPTYLTLLREALMEPTDRAVPTPERFSAPEPPAADPGALREIVTWLINSERPLLLTAYAGRHGDVPAHIAELVDLLAIPVVEQRQRMNLASDHPMHLGYTPAGLIEDADTILLLDTDVPWVPKVATPPATCRIAHIDVDVLKPDIPIWGFPVDLSLQADTRSAVPQMIAIARELLTDADRSRVSVRRELIARKHAVQRRAWREIAEQERDVQPLTRANVANHINDLLPDDAIVLDDAVTSSAAIARYVESTLPQTFFKSGGSSMGWGQGAAIGAKLAAPDRVVVVLDADGNFVDSSPIAPLWAADRYGLPYLTVIFNNSAYNAVLRNLVESYEDSHEALTSSRIGIDLSMTPDFAMLARSCRAHGETVVSPDELGPALERSLARVLSGQAALVDVRTALE